MSGVRTEGNAIEVVRGLEARYDGRIVWLDGPSRGLCAAQGLQRVHGHGRYSFRGIVAFLVAEAVFTTHGAFGNPRRLRRKLTINVWHGSGMKAMPRGLLLKPGVPGPSANVLVSGATVWGEYYAGLTDLRPDEVVYCGNPRVDAFTRRLTAEQLQGLGIEGDFVVWMPTFRTTSTGGLGGGWSDSSTDGVVATQDQAQLAAATIGSAGLTLVVKAHPLDADAHQIPGTVSVTDAQLEASGVTLYQLLGAAGGLLTDASSVWTDFLLLDRPIGFLFPDHAAYRAGRGIHPSDIMQWLPGELLETEPDLRRFADDVRDRGARSRTVRRRSAQRIGLAEPGEAGATAALLDWLAATPTRFGRNLARGRRH